MLAQPLAILVEVGRVMIKTSSNLLLIQSGVVGGGSAHHYADSFLRRRTQTLLRKRRLHSSVRRRYCRQQHQSLPMLSTPLKLIHNSILSPELMVLRGGTGSFRAAATAAGDNDMKNHQKWRRAYLAVGSNLGDRYRNIAVALSSLQSSGTVRLVKTSFLRLTAPMYVTNQPEFLNGAVEIETTLSPLELLREIKNVERDVGRDFSESAMRFGPRVVDLDILLFDEVEQESPVDDSQTVDNDKPHSHRLSLIMQSEVLEIPHPRMVEREFVLSPLRDLETGSSIEHPILNKTVSELLLSLSSRQGKNNDEGATRALPLPRGRMLSFDETIIMGILNVTPDSFSDGGKYYSSSAEAALEQARQLINDGARIIDIGGESTRPGADEVVAEEELKRVLPIIKLIRKESDIPISIDTRHSTVARAAIEAGADIVNDVSGGTHDPEMLSTVASMGVPIVLMHMRGNPKTMQSMTSYGNENDDNVNAVLSGVIDELMQRSKAAEKAGVPRWLQILDPGIGFAKDVDGNLSLLKGAETLRNSFGGIPLLFGPSRKGFIGKISGESNPEERDFGTAAACLAAIRRDNDVNGEACNIVRVHNAKGIKQAVMVFEAIMNAK